MIESNESHRISALERQVRGQRRALVAVTMFAAVSMLSGFVQASASVIRARGIVIVDDKGRERILIGAPIPEARNRVRTDLRRVEQEWAARFPDPKQYMQWYAGYRHSMHGMLVLDENGFDRLAIGDSTPDPNIGKRIGAGPGLDINDAKGFERTGYALLTAAGKDRVVLGLDGEDGAEAVTLSVHSGGHAGLSVRGVNERSIFLGSGIDGAAGATRDTVAGLLIRKAGRDVHRLSTEGVDRQK